MYIIRPWIFKDLTPISKTRPRHNLTKEIPEILMKPDVLYPISQPVRLTCSNNRLIQFRRIHTQFTWTTNRLQYISCNWNLNTNGTHRHSNTRTYTPYIHGINSTTTNNVSPALSMKNRAMHTKSWQKKSMGWPKRGCSSNTSLESNSNKGKIES